MAITWSGVSGGLYIGIDARVVSGPDVSGRVVVRVDYCLEAASGWTHSWTYPWRWSGVGGSGSQPVSYVSMNPNAPVRQWLPGWDVSVQAEYGRATQAVFKASVGPIFNGGAPSVSVTVQIPAREYHAPAAPERVSVSRVSDKQLVVSWRFVESSSAPVRAIGVERKAASDNVWRRVATLDGADRQWADTSVTTNERYWYRVWGHSDKPGVKRESEGVSTTPAPPQNVRAFKDALGVIVVEWDSAAPYPGTGFTVYDNGSRVGSVGPGVTRFAHSSANPNGAHSYRVVMNEAGGLNSGESMVSNTVHVLAPPNAPQLVTSGNVDASNVRLMWVHNPVDSTPQQAAQVRYRARGQQQWVTRSVGAREELTVSVSAGAYEWQVQTRGLHASWSPWSMLGIVEAVTAPTVTLSEPVDERTLGRSRLSVEWVYFQAQGARLVETEIELYDIKTVPTLVESRQMTGSVTRAGLETVLDDGGRYRLRVRVKSGHGIWSQWTQSSFSVSFPQPPSPIVSAVWDDTAGVARVRVDNPGPLDPVAGRRVNLVANGRGRAGDNRVIVRRNLAHDPCGRSSVPAGRLGIREGWAGEGGSMRVQRVSTSEPGLPEGTRGYVVKEWTRIGSDLNDVGFQFAGYGRDGYPARAGQIFAVSAYVRASRSVRPRRALLSVECFDSRAQRVGEWLNSDNHDQLQAGVWERFEGVFTLPAGTAYIRPRVFVTFETSEWMVGDSLACTGVLVEESHTVGEFFDGTFSPDADAQPAWEQGADSSPSTLTGVAPISWDTVNATALATEHGIRVASSGVGYACTRLGTLKRGESVAVSMMVCAKEKGVRLCAPVSVRATQGPAHTVAQGLEEGWEVPTTPVRVTVTGTVPVAWNPSVIAGVYLPAGVGGASVYYTDVTVCAGDNTQHATQCAHVFFEASMGPHMMIDGQSYALSWNARPYESATLATPNSPETVSNRLERSIDNGNTWETVNENLAASVTITDPECLSHGTTLYRATATSSLPTSTHTTTTLTAASSAVWVNAGDGYAHTLVLRRRLKIQASTGLAHQVMHYFHGRPRPVFYDNPATSRVLTVSALTVPERVEERVGEDTRSVQEALDQVSSSVGRKLYRDPQGRRVYGRVTQASFNASVDGTGEASVTVHEGD